MKKNLVAPSILSADFGALNDEIASVEKYSDALHVDVMDGHFVPNLTLGAPIVRCIKTRLPLHCHLMVSQPEIFVEAFAEAGTHTLIVHQEATQHLNALIQAIKAHGMQAGVSINPATPVWSLEEVIDEVDQVLVMSVNPGFGGQKFLPLALEKIAMLREMRSDLNIAVDGGINGETAPQVIEAGANILIAGSYIFGAKNRQKAILSLRP